MKLIPEEAMHWTDEQKRAFAAAHWFGVCIGELVNVGVPEEEMRRSFEMCLQMALKMKQESRPVLTLVKTED